MPPTEEEMAVYRATARAREVRRSEASEARRQHGLAVAKHAAAVLREEFGASRVVLFGSLTRDTLIDGHSDVDLAAWDIDGRLYFKACGRLLSLDGQFLIDLVLYEEASLSMRSEIDRVGVEL